MKREVEKKQWEAPSMEKVDVLEVTKGGTNPQPVEDSPFTMWTPPVS